MHSWHFTIYACYLGNFVQAIIINVAPILFLPLAALYGLSFEQLGRLILVNFVTQVAADLLCSRYVDHWDTRRLVTGAHLLAVFGLLLFAAAPLLPLDLYTGLMAGTLFSALGGGVLELLLSPIVHAIPTGEKAGAMSLLHSFYSWGQLLVVLGTSLLVWLLGKENWPFILLFWSVFPLLGALLFARVPLAPISHGEDGMGPGKLLRERAFAVCLLAMLAGGAAETILAQWASSFMETALGVEKLTGDLLGVCFFAFAMGMGRMLYGRYATRIDVLRAMTFGCLAAALCYLLLAVSPWPFLSLLCCGICGFSVSLLWPGTLVVSASRFPLAGASMFALLASAGDGGGSLGPWLVGLLADSAAPALSRLLPGLSPAEAGLRLGMLAAALFPLMMYFCLRRLRRQ